MGRRVTLTLSVLLVGWSALVWFHREQVALSRPLIHASFWLVVGLGLLLQGLREWRVADSGDPTPTTRSLALAWLIGGLPVFAWLGTWLATRPGWIGFAFTQSSYANALSASVIAALMLAGLAARVRTRSSCTGAGRLTGTVGGAAALLLVAVSLWIHVRVDHSEAGRYGEMAAGFFVLEHPIFWTIAIVAAFALWLSRRDQGLRES